MKKIICPTDFTETAQHAITFAAKLAQKSGAELTLFHVQSLWNLIPVEIVWGKTMTKQAITDRLEELSLEITRVYKISCTVEVKKSNQPVSKLIANVGSQYDLIVMGTNGPENLYEFFVGSKTYQVVKKTQVPLLLLPSNIEFQEIKNIVYAADYFHDQQIPLDQITTWATLLGAGVTLLQIITKTYKQEIEDKLSQLQLHLQQYYNDQITLNFETIYADNPLDGINLYLSNQPCDSLAVNARHVKLLKKLFRVSLTKLLSASTETPLFIFHR